MNNPEEGKKKNFGFYEDIMLPEEKNELGENLGTNIQADIDMMTVSMENYLKKMTDDQDRSWDQAQAQLRAITVAAIAKATLIRSRASMAEKIKNIAEMEKWLREIEEREERIENRE